MLKNFILVFAVLLSAVAFGLLAIMGRDYMTIGHGLHPAAAAAIAAAYAAVISLFLAALMKN